MTKAKRPAATDPPERRRALTAAAASWVLQHGLAALSLRPLAKALGTSDRMLVYHFGSKQGLIEAVVAEAAQRLESALAAAERVDGVAPYLHAVWQALARPERRALSLFFLELHLLAGRHGEPYAGAAQAVVAAWRQRLVARLRRGGHSPKRAAETAELLLAAVDGALLLGMVEPGSPAAAAGLARLVAFAEAPS